MKLTDITEQGGVGVVAANKKQAKDPRYSNSMTVDVKPGEVAKQAAKFGNKLTKAGTPPLLRESRGITARMSGDRYANERDPNDVLTIQDITVLTPPGKDAYDDPDQMIAALNAALPKKSTKVEDNKFTTRAKAAIIAHVKDASGNDQYWVRYIEKVPAAGVHGLWPTLRGYKYQTAKSKEEAIAIKPSDLILDEDYRSQKELAKAVKAGVHRMVDGTADAELSGIMDKAVDLAVAGKTEPISGGVKYAGVISKYSGEYLGPLALLSNKLSKGDISKAMAALEIKSFAGAQVMFSTAKTQELWDSMIKTSDGKTLQISTKMHEGGGAASSVGGIYKQITPEMEADHPKSVRILRALAEGKADSGLLEAAVLLKVIDANTAKAVAAIPKNSRNINDVTDAKLKSLIQSQGVGKDTLTRDDYRVFYHALMAIANKVTTAANADADLSTTMMLALNNNNYLQLVTKSSVSGDSLSLDYYGKFPTVFSGKPNLKNKTYFATGQKGRLGFKLSSGVETEPSMDAGPAIPAEPKASPTNTTRAKRVSWTKKYKDTAAPKAGGRTKRD